jgi:hypothetical protein
MALILIMLLLASKAASAIAEALVRKCRDMAINPHPPSTSRWPAGSKSGYTEAERTYLRDCVANGGKMSGESTSAERTQ